jgi:tetratricopeptide (TPR) repeat protein
VWNLVTPEDTIMKSRSSRILVLSGALTALVFIGGCNEKPSLNIEQPVAELEIDRPPTAKTLYRMGRMLAAQDKAREADAVFMACIDRFPDFIPAYIEAANLHMSRRDFDRAARILEHGLARVPSSAMLHNDLGMTRFLTDDYEGALVEFSAAVELAPGDGRFLANKAMVLAILGRYDESLESYLSVVDAGAAHHNVGVIARARQDEGRATLEFARAKELGFTAQP